MHAALVVCLTLCGLMMSYVNIDLVWYPNQCWRVDDKAQRNTFQGNIFQRQAISLQQRAFENVVCYISHHMIIFFVSLTVKIPYDYYTWVHAFNIEVHSLQIKKVDTFTIMKYSLYFLSLYSVNILTDELYSKHFRWLAHLDQYSIATDQINGWLKVLIFNKLFLRLWQ